MFKFLLHNVSTCEKLLLGEQMIGKQYELSLLLLGPN